MTCPAPGCPAPTPGWCDEHWPILTGGHVRVTFLPGITYDGVVSVIAGHRVLVKLDSGDTLAVDRQHVRAITDGATQ